VLLLAFTVGLMLGIQFISALSEFGAQGQVVTAVAKSVTREFGALITGYSWPGVRARRSRRASAR
jgi:phospholipid/cholesterol/gamma-HCH transport system permease protein